MSVKSSSPDVSMDNIYKLDGRQGSCCKGDSFRFAACYGDVCVKLGADSDGVRSCKAAWKRPDGNRRSGACKTFTKCNVYCRSWNTDTVVSGVESGSKASGCYGSEFYLCGDSDLYSH